MKHHVTQIFVKKKQGYTPILTFALKNAFDVS